MQRLFNDSRERILTAEKCFCCQVHNNFSSSRIICPASFAELVVCCDNSDSTFSDVVSDWVGFFDAKNPNIAGLTFCNVILQN